tara:strand:+ start:89 stop:1204 length:1116 start_codon:yes stop_codon:yes gene_type:complete
MNHIKFIPFVITIFLLASGSVYAASTVVSEGVAAITSNIHVKEYRKRAIENALQNIAFEKEQALTSFTIIENGQLLMDQVRSTSRAGILSYKVLKEERKNKTYYVKIEAVVRDSKNLSDDQIQSDFCRKTNISTVDLDINLYIDPQQFPHWISLDTAWLKSEITKASLKPSILFVSERKTITGKTDLYKLFDGNGTNVTTENLYQIVLSLDFSKAQNETFFIQNKKLSLMLTSEVTRNGQSIINFNKNMDFIFAKKFGTGIPIQNNKKIWQTQKKQIASAVISELQHKLEQLKCIPIKAKLEKNKAKYYIQYGIIDGINDNDIFILETPETQKFYFKVTDLRPTQTYLELISEAGNIAFKDGHTVRIVEGL